MMTSTISHDEVMIKDFMEHPDYAKELLDSVQSDGDEYEKQRVREWYNEAQARTENLIYWRTVVDNAESTAKNQLNLDAAIDFVNQALLILKAAKPVGTTA